MSLSHEHIGPKISAKIKIYILNRSELLFPLCYEIPCKRQNVALQNYLICKQSHLEEIVFEEIPHWFPGVDGPECVEINVEHK